MDFTREPIIETIITPKEGCKLVVRSSKSAGQEEYVVDAVEVVSFGHAFFFRSLERPKAFLAPASDFEVLEVREARMVLKNVGLDRSIKIGGGREGTPKVPYRETEKTSHLPAEEIKEPAPAQETTVNEKVSVEAVPDGRLDKKRDRRRHYRKRRGRDDQEEGVKEENQENSSPEETVVQEKEVGSDTGTPLEKTSPLPPSVLSSLLQPPPMLISETINRYRQNELFKSAFFLSEEDQYKPHDKVEDLFNEEDEVHHEQLIHNLEEQPEHVSHGEVEQFEQELPEPFFNHAVEEDDSSFEKTIELIKESRLTKIEEEDKRLETEAALPLYAEEEGIYQGDVLNPPDLFEEPSSEEELKNKHITADDYKTIVEPVEPFEFVEPIVAEGLEINIPEHPFIEKEDKHPTT